MSGIRESNPLLHLGKVAYYRCTNPALMLSGHIVAKKERRGRLSLLPQLLPENRPLDRQFRKNHSQTLWQALLIFRLLYPPRRSTPLDGVGQHDGDQKSQDYHEFKLHDSHLLFFGITERYH